MENLDQSIFLDQSIALDDFSGFIAALYLQFQLRTKPREEKKQNRKWRQTWGIQIEYLSIYLLDTLIFPRMFLKIKDSAPKNIQTFGSSNKKVHMLKPISSRIENLGTLYQFNWHILLNGSPYFMGILSRAISFAWMERMKAFLGKDPAKFRK